MPRQARIDLPGQLYHVMARGIERGRIFIDENDYADFAARLGLWLKDSGGKCLAWCLMPNHFHFLLLRGERPLSELMHRLMTGYAVNFNGKYQRAGHLFQNRYKAIICDAEEYLFELVPYIHLNPLRAKMVKDVASLCNFKWCGHGSVTGCACDGILDRAAVLSHFGNDEKSAMANYNAVMVERAGNAMFKDLSGGGLIRSLGGINTTLSALRAGERAEFDQRILGSGDFVEAVLKVAGENSMQELKSGEELLEQVVGLTGISRDDILRPSHSWGPARARAIYCFLAKEKGRICGTELARNLKVSQSGISKLIAKGRKLSKELKLVN